MNYLHNTKDEERVVKLVKRKNKINCRLNLYGDKLIEYSGYMRDDLEKDKRINPQYVNLMKSFIDLFNEYFDMLADFAKNETLDD